MMVRIKDFRPSHSRRSVTVWATLCLTMISMMAASANPTFTDVSATNGLDLTPINDRFFNTVELPDLQVIQQTWGNGVAVGDVDGDGEAEPIFRPQAGIALHFLGN